MTGVLGPKTAKTVASDHARILVTPRRTAWRRPARTPSGSSTSTPLPMVRYGLPAGGSWIRTPEVARADPPPHCEVFPVWLRGARRLNLPPPADALARLRIFVHRVLW